MANQKSKAGGRISKQKEYETKKIKIKKIKLIICLFILLISMVCIYLLKSEKFIIKDIDITGYKYLTQEKIYETSGIKLGDNIFTKFNIVTEVKLKESNKYIEDVNVTKQFPNVIKIEITERERDFQIKTANGKYVYIDEQGYLLEVSQQVQQLITLEGMDITEELFESNTRLIDKDLDRMENILQITRKAENIGIFDKITQIQVKDNYVITLGNERININLGDITQLGDKMDFVKSILNDINGQAGTIYVNGNLNEGFKPYFSAEQI